MTLPHIGLLLTKRKRPTIAGETLSLEELAGTAPASVSLTS
jgi:hypothetical protein